MKDSPDPHDSAELAIFLSFDEGWDEYYAATQTGQ